MPEQVGSRSKRSPMVWVAAIALGLAAIVRLIGGVADGTSPWSFAVGALVVVAIVLAVYAAANAGARARLRNVAARRPHSTVVLALPASSMIATATRLGADGKGIKPDGSSYTVLAVLPDRVEFWAGKEQAPRWSVPRARSSVGLVSTSVGLTRADALRITTSDPDGTEIVARPAAMPIWRDLRAKHRQAAMEQLIRDLGHDPADVLGSAS